MLIDSHRLSPADREAWRRAEQLDARLAADPRLNTLEARGIDAIRQWAAAGPGIVGVSWGKDSVVAAHLAHLAGVDAPIVWVRSGEFDMPECEQVRDAYLHAHPDARYEERFIPMRVAMRGEDGYDTNHAADHPETQDAIKEAVRERYVSGIRGDESKVRGLSIGRWGAVTRNTCRPLARWSGVDVFAYLSRECLPVHPAYAMTYGGRRDRRTNRVHMLAAHHFGGGAVEWEQHYYGDVIDAAIAARKRRGAA